ncbi:MAG: type IV pilus secretin PilQ [Oceanospirillaceae bacterium]|nr:type IV pilus secretin PilQ [Oceanospirillaceae bacterium]MCP5351143.1 type IV pilus secretin PilQ [Oceanospirillaceae bacterium]
MKKNIIISVLGLCSLALSSVASALSIQSVDFASLPGDKSEMRLTFDGQPSIPEGYSIDEPARIALDLSGVDSNLKTKYHKIGSGNARTATIVGTKDKTRVIINLNRPTGYTSRVDGNVLVVTIGDSDPVVTAPAKAPVKVTQNNTPVQSKDSVLDVDFRRGDFGEGQVLIKLSNPKAPVDISQESGKIRVVLPNTALPEAMRRRLDVKDFATPVRYVDAKTEDGKTVFIVEPGKELYEYLAYQTDGLLTINLKPVSAADEERVKRERFPYTGEKLSLNFQDIEVRTVLQIIADFTGFNLVASDDVQGSITLRLKNVPWDQALEIVMKSQGLAKRQMGNVLMIGPSDQMAAREKLELEANKQVSDFAPLTTEFVQVKYAKARDLLALIASEKGMLTDRGVASVDERTNTILVKDTAQSIESIRRAVAVFDIPVRQVLIEARIVIARTSVGEDMGIRWGGGYGVVKNNQINLAGGNLDTISRFNNNIIATAKGDDPENIDLNDASIVDLAVTDASATTFAVGVNAFDYMLDLELSALESDGKAEIISQPRVVTADGQVASIMAGTEIPYQEASSSGATTVSFKEAVLKLEVTPQITPDDRIIMDLIINQDSVGELTAAGPSIDTNEVKTQVLVDNGETVVLGGIFKNEEVTQITKTPFFGDLPVIGRLFRRTSHSEVKSELLVFITPRLVKDSLTGR